jgi:membrane protein implicated in regulation of membrane protease activity
MTILGITIHLAIVWLVVAIICLIVEGLTAGLATIWFAGGAFIALVFALFDTGLGLQTAVFLISSVLLLVSTRKIFVEKLKTGTEKTNADALIGQEALVTMDIAPFAPGQAKVNGQVWTAVCQDSDVSVSAGTPVSIVAIEGVKLIVSPSEQAS